MAARAFTEQEQDRFTNIKASLLNLEREKNPTNHPTSLDRDFYTYDTGRIVVSFQLDGVNKCCESELVLSLCRERKHVNSHCTTSLFVEMPVTDSLYRDFAPSGACALDEQCFHISFALMVFNHPSFRSLVSKLVTPPYKVVATFRPPEDIIFEPPVIVVCDKLFASDMDFNNGSKVYGEIEAFKRLFI